MGAVGPAYIFAITNGYVRTYDKQGNILQSNTATNFFNQPIEWFGTSPSIAYYEDAHAVYDQQLNRYIVVALAVGNQYPNAWLVVCVSQTTDPRGLWNRYEFQTNWNYGGAYATGDWGDYPELGIDANGIYATVNMEKPDRSQYPNIFALPKTALAQGVSNITFYNWNLSTSGHFHTLEPCQTFDNPGVEYMIGASDYGDRLELFYIQNFPASPSLVYVGPLYVNAFAPVADAPQAGKAYASDPIFSTDTGYPTKLDISGVNYQLQNAVYRSNRIWTTHTVNLNGLAAVRWYQYTPSTNAMYISDLTDSFGWYYTPSIAVDASADVCIGLNRSSTTSWANPYYVYHDGTDANPISNYGLQPLHYSNEYLYYYYPNYMGNRWGDFSATCVDPVDGSFWTVQEYAGGYIPSGNYYAWATWWNQIKHY